jgi:hypothetical protein
VRKIYSGLSTITRGWEDMNGYLAVRNDTNYVELWHFSKSMLNQELRKIEFVFCIIRCLSALKSPKCILTAAGMITIIPQSPYALSSFPPPNLMALDRLNRFPCHYELEVNLCVLNWHVEGVLWVLWCTVFRLSDSDTDTGHIII